MVPMPMIDSGVASFMTGCSSATKLAGTLSVISRMRPSLMPPCLKTSSAFFTAPMGSLPLMGMISGDSAATMLRMVLLSSVSGVTTWDVPA